MFYWKYIAESRTRKAMFLPKQAPQCRCQQAGLFNKNSRFYYLLSCSKSALLITRKKRKMNIACLLLSNLKLILLHFWLDSEKVECKWNRFRKNETE